MNRLNNIFNWQAKVGRLFGIPIYLHITLLFFLWPVLASTRSVGAGYAIEYVVLVILSILLHELGHALAAKSYKLTGLSITLHGFGGFAVSRGYRSWSQALVITLAGPAVTFVIGAATLLIGNYGVNAAGDLQDPSFHFVILQYLGRLNLLLGVLNLIPTLPFDGGNAVRAILSRKLSDAKATRAAAHLGLVLTPALAIYGLVADYRILAIFALMGLITSYQVLATTGGIRLREFFDDRKVRKQNEAAEQHRREKQEAYVIDITARQRKREEEERLRKLLGD